MHVWMPYGARWQDNCKKILVVGCGVRLTRIRYQYVKSKRLLKHRSGLLITTDPLLPVLLLENDKCLKRSAPE